MRKSYVLLITLTAFLLYPQLLWGKRSFFPKISGYSGDLELDASYESVRNETSRNTLQRTEVDFRERLNLAMAGFVYHPRLLVFRAAGGGGMAENYSSRNDLSGWDVATTEQYELSAIFLPKHSYNLELFTSMRVPLLVGQLTGDTGPVKRYQSGAHLRYKKLPWSGSASYINDKREDSTPINSNALSSDTSDIYRLDFNYFKRFFIVNGSYQHTDSNLADRSVKGLDQFYFDNRISHRLFSLFSNWKLSEEDVVKVADFSTTRRESWLERLNLNLPLHFASGFTFQHDKDRSVIERGDSPTAGADVAFNDAKNYSANLTHHLYNSLRTSAAVTYGDTDSSTGLNKRSSWRLNINYLKKIYRGNVSMGGWTGADILERVGAPRILHERPNGVALLTPFSLNNQNIDKDTIIITVTDDFGNSVDLEEGVYYDFLPTVDDSIEIIITALPSGFDFTDRFEVTYSLIPGEFKLETKKSGYHFRLNLLNNLFSPYYLHSSTAQSLLEGIYPGTLSNGTSDTYGLTVQKNQVIAGVEYQNVDSSVSSERRWGGFANYYRKMTHYTDFTLKLKAERRIYPEVSGEELPTAGLSETLLSSEVQLQSRIPKKHLTFYLAAKYSLRHGFVDSNIYSLNSHLTWYVGKVYVNLGARYSIYRSTVQENISLGNSEYVYIKVKRKFF